MSNKIVKNNKVETVRLVVKPITNNSNRSTSYEAEVNTVTPSNPYIAVMSDVINKIKKNSVAAAVIIGVIVVASGVKSVTATPDKEVKSLCDVPIGRIVTTSGRVVSISQGLSNNDTTLTIEEVGSNCSSNVSLNESRSTIAAKVGDFIEVSGESSSFGIAAKSIEVNPSTQAESRIQTMRLTIHKNDLQVGYNDTYVLGLASSGGGTMVIPAKLVKQIEQYGVHQYDISFINKNSVLEATDIVKPTYSN